MNIWEGIGRVTRDYDLKLVGDKQTENCNFTLAVDRKYKSADGTRPADFLGIVCWGATARFAHTYFQKGARMIVIGTVQSRTYKDKDDKTVYVTEIVAESIEFVDTKKDTEHQERPNINAGIPSSSGKKINDYLPPEIDTGFYPAMDDDTSIPFDL